MKRKLAFSYSLLIVIILAVSGWAIYHLIHLGRSVDLILVNNYKSIVAAENMKEALERLDSSAIFFVASNKEKARQQFADNTSKFQGEYQTAANNVTEPGEDQIVAEIRSRYETYKSDVEQFLNSPQAPSSGELSKSYFDRLEPAFLRLKKKLDDLLRVNQQAMVAASDRARAESFSAQISTAIVVAFGLALALAFAWRFTSLVVGPISLLAQKAKLVGEGDFDQHMSLSSKDEIGVLANEFNRMTARLRDLRKSDYGRLLIEQKKSDAVVDSICEPVIVTDWHNQVTKVNRAAQQLFGGSIDGSNGGANLETIEVAAPIMAAIRDAVSMQRPIGSDNEAAMVPIKLGDAERAFRLRATPMRDKEGRLIGAVTLLEDITAITEVDKFKTEFISLATSKIREPLHSLRLALHALGEGSVGELSDKQNEIVASARQNAENLDELITDLLELAEIESGTRTLTLERLRPVDLARDAIERFRAAADSKQISLQNKVWPDLSWVVGDRRAIARVLDNLLSNAIRHTDRDGLITIEGNERVGRVLISVRDTGDGIPEQYLPAIFSRFVRVADREEGTGLGLALVKQLVEAQGGQVSVKSTPGDGSTFTFALLTGGPASVRHTA